MLWTRHPRIEGQSDSGNDQEKILFVPIHVEVTS